MKTGQALALTVGGVILYNLLAKGSSLANLNFYPGSVSNISMESGMPVMQLGILAQNTSNQRLAIKSLAANLYSSGTLAGNASSFTTQYINPNSQTEIMVKLKLFPIGIVNDIIKIFQFGNFSMTLELDGSINIDTYQVPLNLKYKIGK